MEGKWYDSRGLVWDPTSNLCLGSTTAGPSPRTVEAEVDAHHAMARHQRGNCNDNVATTAGAAPDWVMDMLNCDAANERPQRKASKDPASGRRAPLAGAENFEQTVDTATPDGIARDTPLAYRDAMEDGDPEEGSDEHDDFGDELEKNLSCTTITPAHTTAAAWKMAPSNRSEPANKDVGEEDGDYAEQLALELQRGIRPSQAAAPAAKGRTAGRNKHRRPTAAERREQDAKWLAFS